MKRRPSRRSKRIAPAPPVENEEHATTTLPPEFAHHAPKLPHAQLEKEYGEYNGLMERTLGRRRISEGFDRRATHRLQERARAAAVEEGDTSAKAITAMHLGLSEEDLAREPLVDHESFFDALTRRMGAAPWWVLSGAFHGLLLLLLTLIGMAIYRAQKEDMVIVTNLEQKKKPEEIKKPLKRDVFRKPVPVETSEPVVNETQVVTHEEVEVTDHIETENEMDNESALGDEGISDVPLGGSGTVAALGLGGGGGGAFGQRTGGGRRRLAMRNGGGRATESAVDAALAWLSRHQEKEGFWDTDKYLDNKAYRYGGSAAMSAKYDPGITGFAILTFLGAGHSLRIGKYKKNVQAGVAWLLKQQGPDGDFTVNFRGHKAIQFYCHCIATMACAEALGMNRGRDWGEYQKNGAAGLKDAVQKGVDLILKWQKENSTGGWTYYAPTVTDPTVTGWAVMALKSAKVAGIHIPAESFQRASDALKKITTVDKSKGDYGHAMTGYLHTGAKPFRSKGYAITAAMSVTQLFLGADRQEAFIDAGIGYITQEGALPQWIFNPQDPSTDHQNLYYWYYGTLACFQAGGDAWTKWNGQMKKALVPHQRQGGAKDGSPQDTDGSWDPDDVWGAWAGRVYSTALGALCLEVYYRYLPLYR